MSSVTPDQMVAIIDQYAALVRTGNYFLGHCPGCHAVERMVVRPSIGEWHCYSCGAGGDIVDFIQLAEQCDAATARARLDTLLAADTAPVQPIPAVEAVESSSASNDEQTLFAELLERLAKIKGFRGGSAFIGHTDVHQGEAIAEVGATMQLLATILASGHQLLGEPGEPFGVLVMRMLDGKLMLVEGEWNQQGYSVLLSLEPAANEAMNQLTVRSYLSRSNATAPSVAD